LNNYIFRKEESEDVNNKEAFEAFFPCYPEMKN